MTHVFAAGDTVWVSDPKSAFSGQHGTVEKVNDRHQTPIDVALDFVPKNFPRVMGFYAKELKLHVAAIAKGAA